MTYTEDTIRHLIDKFMAGETSLEEEETIGKWLSTHPDVSEDLKDYQQMFAYFDDGMPQKKENNHRKWWVVLSAAASVALILTLAIPALRNYQHAETSSSLAYQEKKDLQNKSKDKQESNIEKEEKTDSLAIPSLEINGNRINVKSKRRRYHKYQNAPAPPTYLYAKAEKKVDSIMRTTREIDYLVDAQLKKQKEEEEDILNYIFQYIAKQEVEADSIIDRLSSQNMDE